MSNDDWQREEGREKSRDAREFVLKYIMIDETGNAGTYIIKNSYDKIDRTEISRSFNLGIVTGKIFVSWVGELKKLFLNFESLTEYNGFLTEV